MTEELAQRLPTGTKLIFTHHGGGLSYKKGYVFTFANLYDDGFYSTGNPKVRPGSSVQFQEILAQGNKIHNAFSRDLEIYDPDIHKGIEVTQEILRRDHEEFVEKYGD